MHRRTSQLSRGGSVRLGESPPMTSTKLGIALPSLRRSFQVHRAYRVRADMVSGRVSRQHRGLRHREDRARRGGSGARGGFRSHMATAVTGSALDEAVAIAAEQVHEVLVQPHAGISNVTEWAKKQACWERVRNLVIDWPDRFIQGLISTQEQRDTARTARREQRELNGIEAQIAVVNAGGQFWADALTWGRTRRVLTPTRLEFSAWPLACRFKHQQTNNPQGHSRYWVSYMRKGTCRHSRFARTNDIKENIDLIDIS